MELAITNLCFKCSHCKGTLKLSNFSSMEAVKSAEKSSPELTKSPSKAARMFSGTQDKCATCGKTAYPLEKIQVSNGDSGESKLPQVLFQVLSWSGCSLSPSNYAALDGNLYCKPHFLSFSKKKEATTI